MKIARALATVVLLCWAAGASAQTGVDFGKAEYVSNCASCHGVSGKGDGPLAGAYVTKPADLTTLSKRNNGVFPVQRVFMTIDGRREVKAHGPRTMPVWGNEYRKIGPNTQLPQLGIFSKTVRNAIANAKILSIIDYLHRIQAK